MHISNTNSMSLDDISDAKDSFNSKAAFDLGGSEDEFRPDLVDFAWPNPLEHGVFTR